MSSLQALLDAQERRRSLPSRSSGRVSDVSVKNGQRDGVERRLGTDYTRSSSNKNRCGGHGGDGGGGGWNRPPPPPPTPPRTNGDVANRRWQSWETKQLSPQSRVSSREEGGTYEERRARIERRAIEESRAAKRWGEGGRRGGVVDPAADGDDDDEDVQSLRSWVGPLVVIDDGRGGEGGKEEKTQCCTYYQDRDKRYPFITDKRGFGLLTRLMETNLELLQINRCMIEELGTAKSNSNHNGDEECDDDTKDVIIRIGQGLYAHKPTLRTKGVTWSTEEYSHPGLQRMYLRMKSIQRFTEIWSMLERSEALGIFDDFLVGGKRGPVIRIAAVGGGPGYELLATKLFFEDRAPPGGGGMQLELTCMDLCPAWRRYAEALGFSFIEYDIDNKDGTDPLQAMGLDVGELHFCIISCVMIYVTNEKVMNMFHKLMHDGGVNAILVSERGERTSACTMMETLGGKVIRLIDQSDGMDERQAIWSSQEFCDEHLRTSHPDYEAHQRECVFPNVPYCEHKERRRSGSGRSKR